MSKDPSFIKYGEKWAVYGWKADAIGVALIFVFMYGLISLFLDVVA
jgi:hypothetical protein